MLHACIQDLFQAEELGAKQVASVINAAIHFVEAAIHILSQVSNPVIRSPSRLLLTMIPASTASVGIPTVNICVASAMPLF
jgi:hypothetical protein